MTCPPNTPAFRDDPVRHDLDARLQSPDPLVVVTTYEKMRTLYATYKHDPLYQRDVLRVVEAFLHTLCVHHLKHPSQEQALHFWIMNFTQGSPLHTARLDALMRTLYPTHIAWAQAHQREHEILEELETLRQQNFPVRQWVVRYAYLRLLKACQETCPVDLAPIHTLLASFNLELSILDHEAELSLLMELAQESQLVDACDDILDRDQTLVSLRVRVEEEASRPDASVLITVIHDYFQRGSVWQVVFALTLEAFAAGFDSESWCHEADPKPLQAIDFTHQYTLMRSRPLEAQRFAHWVRTALKRPLRTSPPQHDEMSVIQCIDETPIPAQRELAAKTSLTLLQKARTLSCTLPLTTRRKLAWCYFRVMQADLRHATVRDDTIELVREGFELALSPYDIVWKPWCELMIRLFKTQRYDFFRLLVEHGGLLLLGTEPCVRIIFTHLWTSNMEKVLHYGARSVLETGDTRYAPTCLAWFDRFAGAYPDNPQLAKDRARLARFVPTPRAR